MKKLKFNLQRKPSEVAPDVVEPPVPDIIPDVIKDVSEVTAMVVDNSGMFMELARRLARDYKKVYYYVPNDDSAPLPQSSYIGYGFEEIEIVHCFYGQHYDECDLLVFAGVGMGDIQVHCEKVDRKAVWGSRMSERLELDREGTKEILKEAGLSIGPWEPIIGVDNIREYLKKNKEVYLKVSKWRGLMESLKCINYPHTEHELDRISCALGALKNIIPFVVEKKLDNKRELGLDLYTIDGEYPEHILGGAEIKDRGYAGKVKAYSDFPKQLREINEVLSPILKEDGTRCTFSTEARIGEDGKGYVIDLTMRTPSPPGELFQEMATNIAEIYWKGANGILVDIKEIAPYGIQLVVVSDNLNHKEPQVVSFPEKFRENIKLHAAIKDGKEYNVMPVDYEGDETCGAVVGWGNSLKEAAEMASEVAESIEGQSITVDCKGIIEAAEEEIEKSRKIGLEMM